MMYRFILYYQAFERHVILSVGGDSRTTVESDVFRLLLKPPVPLQFRSLSHMSNTFDGIPAGQILESDGLQSKNETGSTVESTFYRKFTHKMKPKV